MKIHIPSWQLDSHASLYILCLSFHGPTLIRQLRDSMNLVDKTIRPLVYTEHTPSTLHSKLQLLQEEEKSYCIRKNGFESEMLGPWRMHQLALFLFLNHISLTSTVTSTDTVDTKLKRCACSPKVEWIHGRVGPFHVLGRKRVAPALAAYRLNLEFCGHDQFFSRLARAIPFTKLG